MTRGHLVLEHAIDQISVGFSFRRDVEEDLDELCESIERFGVIHPPAVTEQYSLISGRRVLAALKKLGYRVTPVWIVHGVSDRLSHVLAIRDEETLRKALKPVEQAELYEELKKLYAQDAERRDAATRFGSPDRDARLRGNEDRDAGATGEGDGGADSAPPSTGNRANDSKARVQAARSVTGRDSRTMLEQISQLQRIAADDDEDPMVRQHAAEALIELNEDGKVNGRFLRVKARQNLARLTRVAEHPDTAEKVRDAARAELAALTGDLAPAEAAKESALAWERVQQIQAATAADENVGWSDVDPLMRQKHQVRKLVDLLRREHGWWDRYDPDDVGQYADEDQWELITSYIDGTDGFLTRASAARTLHIDPDTVDASAGQTEHGPVGMDEDAGVMAGADL